MLSRASLAVALLCGAACIVLAGEPAGDEDGTAFEGMHREAVAVLLGPPHKVKRSGGQETLVYKLRRVDEDYRPSSRERLLIVPGHGRCIARLGDEDGLDRTVSIEPVRTDERGRPIAGGPTSTRSTTITLGEGLPPERPPMKPGKIGSKLKLKLVLEGDRVESWSVSP